LKKYKKYILSRTLNQIKRRMEMKSVSAKEFTELFDAVIMMLAAITVGGSIIVILSKVPWIPLNVFIVCGIGFITSIVMGYFFIKDNKKFLRVTGLLLILEWLGLIILFNLGFRF
jgi:multidrug transporter EmrE-like cation transporter